MMDKFVMIIFGASGDLTKRKLMPALYSLYRDKRLKGGFSVIGVGRTVYSDADYRAYIYTELEQFVKPDEQDKELMDGFTQHLYYLPIDPAIEAGYVRLRERLQEITDEKEPDNLLFYLATPPSLYGVIPLHLKKAHLNRGRARIIVEKPFGFMVLFLRNIRFIVLIIFWERKRHRIFWLSVLPMAYSNLCGIVTTLII